MPDPPSHLAPGAPATPRVPELAWQQSLYEAALQRLDAVQAEQARLWDAHRPLPVEIGLASGQPPDGIRGTIETVIRRPTGNVCVLQVHARTLEFRPDCEIEFIGQVPGIRYDDSQNHAIDALNNVHARVLAASREVEERRRMVERVRRRAEAGDRPSFGPPAGGDAPSTEQASHVLAAAWDPFASVGPEDLRFGQRFGPEQPAAAAGDTRERILVDIFSYGGDVSMFDRDLFRSWAEEDSRETSLLHVNLTVPLSRVVQHLREICGWHPRTQRADRVIGELRWIGHAQPGEISPAGAGEVLNWDAVAGLEGLGDLVADGSRHVFIGCHVGRGRRGEAFIRRYLHTLGTERHAP